MAKERANITIHQGRLHNVHLTVFTICGLVMVSVSPTEGH
jgi:hypothetical protein